MVLILQPLYAAPLKERNLELVTDAHEYPSKGEYKVMVKVIDIFGNDTTHIIEIKNR